MRSIKSGLHEFVLCSFRSKTERFSLDSIKPLYGFLCSDTEMGPKTSAFVDNIDIQSSSSYGKKHWQYIF